MCELTLWVARNSPPRKQVSNLVADPRDMNYYNINIKHGSDEPNISGTSGQERIPGFARFQDLWIFKYKMRSEIDIFLDCSIN